MLKTSLKKIKNNNLLASCACTHLPHALTCHYNVPVEILEILAEFQFNTRLDHLSNQYLYEVYDQNLTISVFGGIFNA